MAYVLRAARDRIIYDAGRRMIRLPSGVEVVAKIPDPLARQLARGGVEVLKQDEPRDKSGIDALIELAAEMETPDLKEAAAEFIDPVPFTKKAVIEALEAKRDGRNAD